MFTLMLTLVHGLPVSGKSTLAKNCVEEAANSTDKTIVHLEADMYFIDDAGVYFFNLRLLNKYIHGVSKPVKRYYSNNKI